MLYEVTAEGFDASSDATDDRVFWVKADSQLEVEEAIRLTGAVVCQAIDCDTGVDFILPQEAERLWLKLNSFNKP